MRESFTDDFLIKTTIYSGFSMAMLNNQMVVMEFEVMMLDNAGHVFYTVDFSTNALMYTDGAKEVLILILVVNI